MRDDCNDRGRAGGYPRRAELFDSARIKPVPSVKPFLKAAHVGRGEGEVLVVDGERIAVARDDAGVVRAVSAVCTHMGCLVRWNGAERSWDCPCHGSRFGFDTGHELIGVRGRIGRGRTQHR